MHVTVLITSFSAFCVPLYKGQFRANTVPSNRTHNYATLFPRKASRISVLLRMSDEGSSFLFRPASIFHQCTDVRCHVILGAGATSAHLHCAVRLRF